MLEIRVLCARCAGGGGGGSGFFLAGEDFGKMVGHSFPVRLLFFVFCLFVCLSFKLSFARAH